MSGGTVWKKQRKYSILSLSHREFTDDTVISEPYGSGGYGIALYEFTMHAEGEKVTSPLRYTSISTTGSSELATVKVRSSCSMYSVSFKLFNPFT